MLGTDFSGGFDLDPALRESTGQRALAEAIIRRLTTTLGALQDHPDYGFNISSLIGSSMPPGRIQAGVLAQVLLEEEVDDATVAVTSIENLIEISINVVAGEGPFDLTISVDDLKVSAIIPPGL